MLIRLTNSVKSLALLVPIGKRAYLTQRQIQRLSKLLGGHIDEFATHPTRAATRYHLEPKREVVHHGGHKVWSECELNRATRVFVERAWN